MSDEEKTERRIAKYVFLALDAMNTLAFESGGGRVLYIVRQAREAIAEAYPEVRE